MRTNEEDASILQLAKLERWYDVVAVLCCTTCVGHGGENCASCRRLEPIRNGEPSCDAVVFAADHARNQRTPLALSAEAVLLFSLSKTPVLLNHDQLRNRLRDSVGLTKVVVIVSCGSPDREPWIGGRGRVFARALSGHRMNHGEQGKFVPTTTQAISFRSLPRCTDWEEGQGNKSGMERRPGARRWPVSPPGFVGGQNHGTRVVLPGCLV